MDGGPKSLKRGRNGAEAPGTDPEGDGTLVAEREKQKGMVIWVLGEYLQLPMLQPTCLAQRFLHTTAEG